MGRLLGHFKPPSVSCSLEHPQSPTAVPGLKGLHDQSTGQHMSTDHLSFSLTLGGLGGGGQ